MCAVKIAPKEGDSKLADGTVGGTYIASSLSDERMTYVTGLKGIYSMPQYLIFQELGQQETPCLPIVGTG